MKSISGELKDLYYSNLIGIENIYKFEIENNYKYDLDGPNLIYCWDEYYTRAKTKILFIGQEGATYAGGVTTNIESQLNGWKDFRLSNNPENNTPYKKPSTPFWKGVYYVNSLLNPENILYPCFLYNNVCKYSNSAGGPISLDVHKFIVSHLNLLQEEIQIVKPDVVIFLSGPNYDDKIRVQFEGELKFMPIMDKISARELARVSYPGLPENTFRTYHPRYLQSDKYGYSRWNYLQLISAVIKGIDLNEILETLKKQLIGIEKDLSLKCDISKNNFGQLETGFYFKKNDWKYLRIGFEFEAYGLNELYYGVCKISQTSEVPSDLIEMLKQKFGNSDDGGSTQNWPFWKWFEHRNWNMDTFHKIKNGDLNKMIINKIEEMLRKLDELKQDGFEL